MSAQEILVQVLGNKCAKCGSTDRLQLHHKDQNRKNNDLSNVILLCRMCHVKEHRPSKMIHRRTITFTDEVLGKVEEWRRKQPKIPSFSKAVNTLLRGEILKLEAKQK